MVELTKKTRETHLVQVTMTPILMPLSINHPWPQLRVTLLLQISKEELVVRTLIMRYRDLDLIVMRKTLLENLLSHLRLVKRFNRKSNLMSQDQDLMK